jgi:hypothetical protein
MRKITSYAVVVMCFFIFCSAEAAFSSGSLEVTISPQGAIDAGAQWRRVGTSTWLNSEIPETEIPAGKYSIEFRTVAGWTAPGNRSVEINNNATAKTSGTYTQQRASLAVTIIPEPAVIAGAQWRVDEGDWLDSGETLSVFVGEHTVEFRDVEGWTKPDNRTVTLRQSRTTLVTVEYIPRTGFLQVTIEPAGAREAGAQWRHQWMEPGIWLNSGATENIPAGPCTVEFKDVSDWTKPNNQTVNIVEGETTTATGTYVPVQPSITVTTPNGGENWAAGTTQTISWTYVGSVGNFVKIELFKAGVLNQTIISSSSICTVGSGSYPWAIPSTQAGGSDYQFKVTSTTNSAYTDRSNANFTIIGPLPVVTVTVTDGSATEAGPTTGMYRISRTGGTVSRLSVLFTMGGLAQNGVDYNAITSPVTIPAGASYVYVTLRPIDDSVHEGNETAILTISPDPNYNIGSSSSATITIQDND